MNRRGFLGAILALGAAPAIVRAESLMRIKPVLLPGDDFQYFPGLGVALPRNALITPTILAQEALEILERHLVFAPRIEPGAVHRVRSAQTITVRKPRRYG